MLGQAIGAPVLLLCVAASCTIIKTQHPDCGNCMASLQQLLRLRPFAATQLLAGSTAVLLSDLGVSVCSSSYINDQELCQLSSAQISSRDTPNFPPSTPSTSGFSILNGQICSTGLLNSIPIVTLDAQQSIVLPGKSLLLDTLVIHW